jgi:hypothetical protein
MSTQKAKEMVKRKCCSIQMSVKNSVLITRCATPNNEQKTGTLLQFYGICAAFCSL